MHEFVSSGFEHKDSGMQILKPLAQFEDNISGHTISLVSQNISLLWPVKRYYFSGQLKDFTSLAS